MLAGSDGTTEVVPFPCSFQSLPEAAPDQCLDADVKL